MCWKIYKINEIPEEELDVNIKRFSFEHMHLLELFDYWNLGVKKFFSKDDKIVDTLEAINRVLVNVRYPFDWRGRPTDYHYFQAFKVINGKCRFTSVNKWDFFQKASETCGIGYGDR